jgi:hypothetical protein
VTRWTCPTCEREFGRAHQAHVCVPGCTVDQCFAPWPPLWREIYDALLDHLATLGPVHADAVRVGVFLKSERKLAEVRPKARSLSLELVLPYPLVDARIARTGGVSADRVVHVIKLTRVEDVDQRAALRRPLRRGAPRVAGAGSTVGCRADRLTCRWTGALPHAPQSDHRGRAPAGRPEGRRPAR